MKVLSQEFGQQGLILQTIGIIFYIAIAMGKGEKENGRKACVQSFLLSFLLGMILMGIAIGISPFLPKWMGADQSIRKIASDYFKISYYGMIGMSFNILLGSVLKGAGNMKTPMYVNVGMNLLNICFNLLFIYESRVIEIGGIHILLQDLVPFPLQHIVLPLQQNRLFICLSLGHSRQSRPCLEI